MFGKKTPINVMISFVIFIIGAALFFAEGTVITDNLGKTLMVIGALLTLLFTLRNRRKG